MSQSFKSHHTQRYQDVDYNCHSPCVKSLLNHRCQRCPTWIYDKRTGLLLSGPRCSPKMKVNVALHLESLEEDCTCTESSLPEIQCNHLLTFPIVFYQINGQHSI